MRVDGTWRGPRPRTANTHHMRRSLMYKLTFSVVRSATSGQLPRLEVGGGCVDERKVQDAIAFLDEEVPRGHARVKLDQYGGGPDESRIIANKDGFLRLGVEFLKAAYAPITDPKETRATQTARARPRSRRCTAPACSPGARCNESLPPIPAHIAGPTPGPTARHAVPANRDPGRHV